MKLEEMTRDQLIKKVDELEHQKIQKSSKLFKITKEFNLIDDELQKAKALLFNKNIEQRYQTKICQKVNYLKNKRGLYADIHKRQRSEF